MCWTPFCVQKLLQLTILNVLNMHIVAKVSMTSMAPFTNMVNFNPIMDK